MSQVSIGDVLFGWAAPTEVSLKNRIIALIALQRPATIVLGFFPLAMAQRLCAGARLDDPRFPFGLIMVWLLVSSDHVINDVFDAERDKRKWPAAAIGNGVHLKIRGGTLFYYTGRNSVHHSTCGLQLAQCSNNAFGCCTCIYLWTLYA